jgi:hypothetical protein
MKRKLFWTFAIIFAAGMLATIRVSAPAASRRRRLAEVSLVRCPPAERSRCRRGRPQSGTFRATEITAYLSNGGTLEHAQEMAAHEARGQQSFTTGPRSVLPRTRWNGSGCRRRR